MLNRLQVQARNSIIRNRNIHMEVTIIMMIFLRFKCDKMFLVAMLLQAAFRRLR